MSRNSQKPLGSCRGDQAKERILDQYKLEETFHGIALNDDITGCCEDTPLADYHKFEFKIREGRIQTRFPSEGTFYVGSHCANEFRRLMMERGEGHDYPALFNPLMSQETTGGSPSGGTKGNAQGNNTTRPTITVEGEEALSLMLSLYPRAAENRGAMHDIYEQIRNAPDKPLSSGQIKGINTSIGNYLMKASRGDTLIETARKVASTRGQAIRDFTFPELSATIERYKSNGWYDKRNALETTQSRFEV